MQARVMADGALEDAGAPGAHLHQQLGGDEGRVAVQVEAVDDAAVNELVGAVDVAYAHTKQQAAGLGPQPGVDLAHDGIGAAGPVADDGIGALGARLGDELGDLVAVELAVGVCQEQPRSAGAGQSGGDAGADGGTVSPVHLVVDH